LQREADAFERPLFAIGFRDGGDLQHVQARLSGMMALIGSSSVRSVRPRPHKPAKREQQR
jgi:hypothetical protein